jgi:hypothetical protein
MNFRIVPYGNFKSCLQLEAKARSGDIGATKEHSTYINFVPAPDRFLTEVETEMVHLRNKRCCFPFSLVHVQEQSELKQEVVYLLLNSV